jgi:hypothetical protein
MSRLLIAPKHDPQPLPNGSDRCYGRWGNAGCCPGLSIAEWLNTLGEDEAPYGQTSHKNLDVRLNWLKNDDHLVALEPEVARLREKIRNAERELVNAHARFVAITGESAKGNK